jgi:hypothetical protein
MAYRDRDIGMVLSGTCSGGSISQTSKKMGGILIFHEDAEST